MAKRKESPQCPSLTVPLDIWNELLLSLERNVDRVNFIRVCRRFNEASWSPEVFITCRSPDDHFHFVTNFNDFRVVSMVQFPRSIKKLKVNYDPDVSLSEYSLPSTLTHFTFWFMFNEPLNRNLLPPMLTHLEFGYMFNRPLDHSSLPLRLTNLDLGPRFNRPLPPGLLPITLTHLTFGTDFNQTLYEGCLPPRLTYLYFGADFNQPLAKGCLPPLLTYLNFGSGFCQSLPNGVLPPLLIHLRFCGPCRGQLDNDSLPDGLVYLELMEWIDDSLIRKIPRSVKCIGCRFGLEKIDSKTIEEKGIYRIGD